jgi:plastocyanin
VNARLLILAYVTGLTIGASAKDDASLEGTVQLPPPAVERALNQRYGANVEAPLTPSNPPAAVVYLEGNFTANAKPKSGDVAQMAQKNMLFAPDLIAVHTGSVVEFPNVDDTYHNVFSYSKAKRFDLGRYRKDEKPGTSRGMGKRHLACGRRGRLSLHRLSTNQSPIQLQPSGRAGSARRTTHRRAADS